MTLAVRRCTTRHLISAPRRPISTPKLQGVVTYASANDSSAHDDDSVPKQQESAEKDLGKELGNVFKGEKRRKGRPAHMRSPYDTPLRDGNRDRLLGLLTER